MTPFPTRPLGSSGVRIGAFGLGGATIGGLHGPVPACDARAALEAAWAGGIRSFDTSPLYGTGEGERRVGAFLADRPRAETVLSTKTGWLVDDGAAEPRVEIDYTYSGTVRSLEASLDRLGVARFDVVFIHDLDASNHGDALGGRFAEAMAGACVALREWQRSGRIGAVGIGVNDPEICVAALDHGPFDVFLLAGRYTLLDQEALRVLLPLCRARGASLISGAPFNTGILAKGAVPGATFAHRPASKAMLDRVGAIAAMALRHGVTLAAAALQFPLGHASVASVLPGPRSADQTNANVAAMRETIPADFWRDLVRHGLLPDDVPLPLGLDSSS